MPAATDCISLPEPFVMMKELELVPDRLPEEPTVRLLVPNEMVPEVNVSAPLIVAAPVSRISEAVFFTSNEPVVVTVVVPIESIELPPIDKVPLFVIVDFDRATTAVEVQFIWPPLLMLILVVPAFVKWERIGPFALSNSK